MVQFTLEKSTKTTSLYWMEPMVLNFRQCFLVGSWTRLACLKMTKSVLRAIIPTTTEKFWKSGACLKVLNYLN